MVFTINICITESGSSEQQGNCKDAENSADNSLMEWSGNDQNSGRLHQTTEYTPPWPEAGEEVWLGRFLVVLP